MKRTTLRDIARQAKVSVMTVSYALRNHPSISESTRRKIQTLAVEMGYSPDPVLAALNFYRSNLKGRNKKSILGFLSNWNTPLGWKDIQYISDLYDGALQRALELGYSLENIWLRDENRSKRISDILYHRGIQGLLIAPVATPKGHIRLDWEKFSSVSLSLSIAYPNLHYAANDHYRSMIKLIHQLRRMGYKRITLMLEDRISSKLERRWEAAYNTYRDSSQHKDLLPAFIDAGWTRTSILSWLRQSKPEVVISSDFRLPTWFDSWGIRIPDQLGFASLDVPKADGTVAGIFQNGKLIGNYAVDLLNGLILRGEKGIPSIRRGISMEGVWVDGATVRAKRKVRPKSNPDYPG